LENQRASQSENQLPDQRASQSENQLPDQRASQSENQLPDQRIFLSCREGQGYPSLVKDAISLIECNYAFLYGIDDLAAQLEVTKPHLIRTFTASAGISPGKYLTRIRIYHAQLLLSSGSDTPMEMVAGACGYSCANYFSKVFKKHTGLTPTEYALSVNDTAFPSRNDMLLQRLYL